MEAVAIRSETPFQIEVPLGISDDEFTVLVNEHMEIAEIES
jgi:hypothetical protein